MHILAINYQNQINQSNYSNKSSNRSASFKAGMDPLEQAVKEGKGRLIRDENGVLTYISNIPNNIWEHGGVGKSFFPYSLGYSAPSRPGRIILTTPGQSCTKTLHKQDIRSIEPLGPDRSRVFEKGHNDPHYLNIGADQVKGAFESGHDTEVKVSHI